MRCTEAVGRFGPAAALLAAAIVAGCSSPKTPPAPVAAGQPTVVQPPPVPARPPTSSGTGSAAPVAPASSTRPPATPAAASTARARNWEEWRRSAALRLVAANRSITYDGAVPEPLLAIPIIEIELNADGSVRRIVVTRQPGQARDTVQLAIDAVNRAAPFAEVGHLPRPWKYTEVFLFADDRRFKPRTLDV